jgi:hypothetical protein
MEWILLSACIFAQLKHQKLFSWKLAKARAPPKNLGFLERPGHYYILI